MQKFVLAVTLTLVFVSVLALRVAFAAGATKPPLFGVVVIIDPGHGGTDPGTHGDFIESQSKKRVTVYEAPYVYDVSKRLANRVRELGGIPLLTRSDVKNTIVNNDPPSSVLPFFGNKDRFTTNGALVRAAKPGDTFGLDSRLALVRRAQTKFKDHHIVWISIHFDTDGDKTIEGSSVIGPAGEPLPFAMRLVNALQTAKRARHRGPADFMPYVESGDRDHGLRNLYVLRKDKNPLADRVLIELGNFQNPADVWRIRKPEIRADYARIMAESIAP